MNNKLIRITAIYQLLMAFVSLIYLFVGIIQNVLNNYIAIIALVVFGSFVVITILTNIQILVHIKRLKPFYFTVNAIICLVQSFHVFTDGFYYKYVQGLGLIGYIAVVNLTKKVTCGLFLTNVVWEFTFKFDESDGTLIGVNLIAFALMLYFYWLSRNIDYPGGRLSSERV